MKIFVNVLTIFRLLATFMIPFIWNYASPIVIVLFVAFTLFTDFLDGKLARIFKVQTLFGSILDTIADKMFGIVIILILAQYHKGFYLMMIMELLIALINVIAAILGATTKSSFLGKCKMWVLGIAIFLGLVSIFQDNLIRIDLIKDYISLFIENEKIIISNAVFMTIGSEIIVAIDYFRHVSKELITNKKKIKYQFKTDDDLKKVLFDTTYYLEHKTVPLSESLLK